MKRIIICFLLLAFAGFNSAFAQQDVSKMTKEDIMQLSYDDLLAMPFEDLLTLANKLGVSTDELFAMIMNKSVSSASKSEESSFTSPLASTVITKAEIRSYGISTIEEALRLVPGVIVQEKTNGMYDVYIRGLNNIPDNQMMLYTANTNTLIMIDGRIVHNYADGAVQFEVLPIGIEDIERIEVVRGANAALYGQNAVTGVINIITEKPTELSKTVQGGFHMGTHENYVGDIALRYRVNKKLGFGITANLQYRRRNTNQLYVYPHVGLLNFKDPNTGLSVIDPNTGNLIAMPGDASKGGFYNASDIPYLRQAFSFGALKDYLPDYVKENVFRQVMENHGFSNDEEGRAMAKAYTEGFLNGLVDTLNKYTQYYSILENTSTVDGMFSDLGLSRKTMGYNGYVNYQPTEKINFDLSFGYQQSFVNTTPIGELPFSIAERTSKTGYVNLEAHIADLSMQVNYMAGPQDHQKGIPGFKERRDDFAANVEYDFRLGDLQVVPGLAYKFVRFRDYCPDYVNPDDPNDYTWELHDPDTYTYDDSKRHLSGYTNYHIDIKDFAPSLRFDYKLGDLRAIAAGRLDKTNIPDKWNPSWQIGLSYSFNDNNFMRLSYASAMRAASGVNSGSDYRWTRAGLMPPDKIHFLANAEAPLVKSNNVELGYRWKPTDRLLVDAEAFYSRSTDFGALMANSTKFTMPASDLLVFLSSNADAVELINEGQLDTKVLLQFMQGVTVETDIKYKELPYEVNQYGFGLNVDWIISPKLIAKLNANVQHTVINNYYAYNQEAEIMTQVGGDMGLVTLVPSLMGDIEKDVVSYINQQVISGAISAADAQSEAVQKSASTAVLMRAMATCSDLDNLVSSYESMNEEQRAAMLDGLRGGSYSETLSADEQYSAYFALEYGVRSENGIVNLGNAGSPKPETENGHVHKATPSVYGMVGLIYKPTPKIDITAFGNYIGKRTYQTKYGAEELSDRFIVNLKAGYKPAEGVEIFVNAHNLFNSKQREFPYADEIGGVYSVGLNFAF